MPCGEIQESRLNLLWQGCCRGVRNWTDCEGTGVFSAIGTVWAESTASGNSTRQPLCCLTAKRLKPRHACKRFPARLYPMVVVQQSSINSRSSTVSESTRILSSFQNTGRIATSGFECVILRYGDRIRGAIERESLCCRPAVQTIPATSLVPSRAIAPSLYDGSIANSRSRHGAPTAARDSAH